MIKVRPEVYEKCIDLKYTNATEHERVALVPKTIEEVSKIWCRYGIPSTLATLDRVWSLEQSLDLFEYYQFQKTDRAVKTICTHYIDCCNGGIERVQSQLICLWKSMGYEVVLLTEQAPSVLDYYYPADIKRIVIPSSNKLEARLKAIEDVILHENIDIYINHNWLQSSVLWECLLCRLMNIPFVNYIHGYYAWDYDCGEYSLLTSRIFSLCNLVLTLSETSARFYQLCGCDSYFISNPIPTDLKLNSDVTELNEKNILYVGRLSEEKRPLDAVKIFKLIHDRYDDARMYVIGDEPFPNGQKKAILDFCKREGLSDCVKLCGFMPQNEVREYYKKAALLLFTSEMEAFGMVILEAKAYGVPIVAYDLGYLSLLKKKEGLETVRVGSVDEAAMVANRLIGNSALLQKYGNKSRNSFEVLSAIDDATIWREIVSLCTSSNNAVSDWRYYKAELVSELDEGILPLLLSRIYKGYDVYKGSVDYRLGQRLLSLPRRILRLIANIGK